MTRAKLTSCESCGMEWTAKPREMCPRCELERVKAMRDRYQLRVIKAAQECMRLRSALSAATGDPC